jgi:hypothetical protein
MRTACLLAVGVFLVGVVPADGQDKLAKYLTKDGKLAQKLVVKDLQSGFAGVTGRVYVVEPSGEWTSGNQFQGKIKMDMNGKLSAEEMKALAGQLAEFDAAGLESKKMKVGANPKSVVVQWGDKEAVLVQQAGTPLAKADPATVEGRYAGIVLAVRKLLVATK